MRAATTSLVFLALLAWSSLATAAPNVRLRVDPASTCEGTSAVATRLAARGITVEEGAKTTASIRATTGPGGAEASLAIATGGRVATRVLTAPTCDEVLDALSFALSLSLEQTDPEPAPAPPSVTPPPLPPTTPPPPPTPAAARATPLQWGGSAAFGIFAGASPDIAPVLTVRADLESTAPRALASAVSIGAAFVFPTETTIAGGNVAFALQTGLVDGCPVRFGDRLSLRPCVELQLGRLQSRAALVPNPRLASSAWVALAASLRVRAEIAAGIGAELTVTGGSPLTQDAQFIGNSRVFQAGPLLFDATIGVGVHFR